jgi:ribosome-associated protein
VTDAKPSKSARKREYQALQELGEQLILLADDELASIATDDYLLEQVREAKRISAHSALRRQKQLIGKIMRELDPEPIRVALAELGQADRHDKAVFKQAERWRDRIVSDGHKALQSFEEEVADAGPALEGFVRDYSRTGSSELHRQLRRKIFREIHRILADPQQKSRPGI